MHTHSFIKNTSSLQIRSPSVCPILNSNKVKAQLMQKRSTEYYIDFISIDFLQTSETNQFIHKKDFCVFCKKCLPSPLFILLSLKAKKTNIKCVKICENAKITALLLFRICDNYLSCNFPWLIDFCVVCVSVCVRKFHLYKYHS